MKEEALDIYIDRINNDYLSELSFITLFRSRSLGFRSSADLFCEAYKEFNPRIVEEALHAIELSNVSRYLRDHCQIFSREDICYVVRHPSLIDLKADCGQKAVRKKVFRFTNIDEPGNNYKKEAFLFLNNMRPIMRAYHIDKIVKQYLILTGNAFYVRQATARLFDSIIKNVDFDEEGRIIGVSKVIIDTIWNAAR